MAEFVTKTADDNKEVKVVAASSLDGDDAFNYSIVLDDDTPKAFAEIFVREVTIDGEFTVEDKVYDGNASATIDDNELELINTIAGDTVSLVPVAAFDTKNIGADKPVTLQTTSSLNGADAANYILSVVGSPTTEADITAKQLTIDGEFTVLNKIYDGNVEASINDNDLELVGIVGSENVQLNAVAEFVSRDIGTDIEVVLVATSSLADTPEAANYVLSVVGSPTTKADITAKGVTIKGDFTVLNKVFDGTVNADIDINNLVLDGIVAGDKVTLDPVAEFIDRDTGTGKQVILVAATSISGAHAGNYELSLVGAPETAANIASMALTITGSFTVEAKDYDQTTDVVVTSTNLTLVGLADGDEVTLIPIITFADKSAGPDKEAILTIASMIEGADVANYVLSLENAPIATADIAALEVTIGGSFTVEDKVDDNTTDAVIVENKLTISGVLDGDDVKLVPVAAFADSEAAVDILVSLTTATSLSGADAENYYISLVGAPTTKATIEPAFGPDDILSVSVERLAVQTRRNINARSVSFEVWNAGTNDLDYVITTDADWLAVSPATGISSGEVDQVTVSFSTKAMVHGRYTATITVTGGNENVRTIDVILRIGGAAYDFDGDGLSDPWYYHEETGMWYYRLSSTMQLARLQFGFAGTYAVPGDYDGDGITDHAVYHPATGQWYILTAQGDYSVHQFGFPGTVPIPGDYDGDGKTDLAIYEVATGMWYIYTTQGDYWELPFGFPGVTPAPADFDGDLKTDLAVFYPPLGQWYILTWAGDYWQIQFGWDAVLPAPGDCHGTGQADLAVYHPADGMWYMLTWDGRFTAQQFGFAEALPVPADYDGDGITDMGVFHRHYFDADWYLLRSTKGFEAVSSRDSRP